MSKELPKNSINVSSLSEFRNKNPIEVVTLPSGLVVKLRKPSVTRMATMGNLPTQLLSFLDKNGNNPSEESLKKPENLQMLLLMMKYMIIDVFVEPKVSMTGTNEVLGIDELLESDIEFLQKWINQGVESLKTFRTESEQPDGAGSNLQEVSQTA